MSAQLPHHLPLPLILLVDDDALFRRALAIALRLEGCQVLEAANGVEALQVVSENPIELAVVDLLLGEERGDEVLEQLAVLRPQMLLASTSGYAGLVSAVAARGRAIHLEKPVTAADVTRLLQQRVGEAR